MKVVLDDYGYVYVQLAAIKSLIMTEEELKKINSLNDLETLQHYITRFYPNFALQTFTLDEFERTLWNTFYDILGRILIASPQAIQSLLKSLLVRHEIWNIKEAVYAVIANIPFEERSTRVYTKPSFILGHEDFLSELLHIEKVKDISIISKGTPYETLLTEGLAQYEKSGEIFYLANGLDQFYYINLHNKLESLPRPEKAFIESFIRNQIDAYNVNLIFRALYNQVSLEYIRRYLVFEGDVFQEGEITALLECKSVENLTVILEKILRKKKKYPFLLEIIKNSPEKSWDLLPQLFLQDYLITYHQKIIADIMNQAISWIFRILIQKTLEIQAILARAVRITLLKEKLII